MSFPTTAEGLKAGFAGWASADLHIAAARPGRLAGSPRPSAAIRALEFVALKPPVRATRHTRRWLRDRRHNSSTTSSWIAIWACCTFASRLGSRCGSRIFLNGRWWLARRLTARSTEQAKTDNVFIRAGAGAPDHHEEGCRGTLLLGVGSVGATRRHAGQEPHGQRALPARLHEPRHPIAAQRQAMATFLRRQPEEGQREGLSLFPAAARAWPDRPDSARPAMALH